MSDRIFFQPSELNAAATRIKSQALDLNQMLQKIRTEIESLNSTWQGQAASRFDQLMSEYRSDSLGIDEVLSEVSQHLTQAAQSYFVADAGIARGFSLEADRPK